MAKIKMSSVGITNINGKAGGSIYTKNKGGLYFKNFVPPSNPSSSAQTGVRGQFGSIASAWKSLTEGERSGWRQASPNFPYQDVFGDTKTYSGFNLFMKLNQNLEVSGQAGIDSAPQQKGVTSVDSGESIAIDTTAMTLTGNLDLVVAAANDGAAILQMTGSVSPGINSFGTRYRQVTSESYASSATQVLTTGAAAKYTLYVAKFGTPAAGDNIGARVRCVNDVGETSPWVDVAVTVT